MQFIRSFNSSDNILDNIIHGANPENLFRAFNIKIPEKIFDFSTNTNILSWPKIEIDLERLTSSYPDIECLKLRELISEREKIGINRILFTNGINEAIFLLSNFCNDVGILQPCYSEYSRAFRNSCSNIFDVNEAGRFKTFILTNPNNPTGKYINNLSETIKKFPNTKFIIDEAYRDFLIDEKPERLCDFENVILLRSLTKIFHLSGVRIGYVIANEKIINTLKKFQPSWSVNSVAQELALKFLNDHEFYERTRKFYRKNTPMFIKNLKSSGIEVIPSDVHYFLVRVENDIETIKSLLKIGIVVRHTRNFKFNFEGSYIRIATRFEDENEKITHLTF